MSESIYMRGNTGQETDLFLLLEMVHKRKQLAQMSCNSNTNSQCRPMLTMHCIMHKLYVNTNIVRMVICTFKNWLRAESSVFLDDKTGFCFSVTISALLPHNTSLSINYGCRHDVCSKFAWCWAVFTLRTLYFVWWWKTPCGIHVTSIACRHFIKCQVSVNYVKR